MVVAGTGGIAGRAGRGRRIERALSAQVSQQTFLPSSPRQSERFEEGRPEFGRHDVVQDGIDGRIEVEHDAAKVQRVVISFDAHRFHLLVRRQDDPQRKNAERQ